MITDNIPSAKVKNEFNGKDDRMMDLTIIVLETLETQL